MGGGLLNLVAYGNLNIIVNGNPSKTFFKTSYKKYTNFGLQKFRLDFEGQKMLRLNESSIFNFNVPRYADLLMDTYLSVLLPNIWSPIIASQGQKNWKPYEFKWIDNIGCNLIKEVTFTVGGQIIQKFSGQYLYNIVKRDFTHSKQELFNQMTGNYNQLNDPKSFNNGNYPNAWYIPENQGGPQPSIPATQLFIPLNIWFTLASKMAFPLVSLQYNLLQISIECRPIYELFVIRDVLSDSVNGEELNYIQPDQNVAAYQFYRFLQPPPEELIFSNNSNQYIDKRTDWFADIHLISTFGFLGDDEVRVFAGQNQSYLIKEVQETDFYNVTGKQKLQLYSFGLVSSWMWYFQRNDAYLRNEWTNYSNWPYSNTIPYPAGSDSTPFNIQPVKPNDRYSAYQFNFNTEIPNSTYGWVQNSEGLPPTTTPGTPSNVVYGPATQPVSEWNNSNIKITGNIKPQNQKDIMLTWALLLDGNYRENTFSSRSF